ncbi:hypothetical protein CY34DRAFT_108820 [Suillus luteus UH-Slu-Lm8-n1]|uniref:Uncharacterized protein n=1 Tax=Suillus luteus UH-Slu-Lm8-n1 TaxID=930992 RepID=A0A0D0AUS3_9AGAM|nr:hypothetical protein CY34DRAFT_108820 [Suillus luteus UH-Slu-Lm8-n1]
MTGIQLDKWRSGRRLIALPCMAILMCLVYTIPLSLLGILMGALYFLRPPDDQPVVDVSRSVLWLCQTSLDPDAVFIAAKRIPDVTFPTDGPGSWAAWGKLFRLFQDGLKQPSPSPSVLIYAKALTSLYFTAYTSKNRFSPMFSHVGVEDVATLRVDMHCSHDVTSLCFVLTVLQQWFDVVSGSWPITRVPEGKDIINALGSDINLDDIPDDTLEWFLHPLLHGLCGAPLPWYKGENHRRHLFLQPLAIYIIRRLLPIDRPRPLPSRKTIARCLHVMIAILDWQSINLEDIKITDNSDNIETIFPRVLDLLLRLDITAAIQDDPIPTVLHPEATRSGVFSRIPQFIFPKSPRSRTFSANEVSHFRAILEPLARLASETEFRRHFEDNRVAIWSTGVFQATVPKNIEDASTPALCLHACCTMDDLFRSGVMHSATIWGSCQANSGASVLLNYLNQAHPHPRPPQADSNSDTAFHIPPRTWLDPEFHNDIATAHALLMLSVDNTIFTPETTTAVVPRIILAMEHTESPLHRHVGLKIAHVIKEPLVNITADVRDQLLPALRSATFGNIQSDTITPGDTSPDRFVYPERDLHYLEILFALANSEYWLLQLRQDSCHHMQRCISIAKALHTPSRNEEDYREVSLRLVLIFARIACVDDYAWPEWDIWSVARPDNQALLVKQAWGYPRILDECPDGCERKRLNDAT